MDRRAIIRTIGSLVVLAAPRIAKAQTKTSVRRIGELDPGEPESAEYLEDDRAARRKLGWIEGQNLLVERRYARGRADLLRPLAEELVRLRVELIVTGGTAATLAAKSVTNTIPIVFNSAGDPVRTGLVTSLGRPGGNVTGYSLVETEISAKRLALLHECVPAIQRVGVLQNPLSAPYYRATREGLEAAFRSLGLQPIFIEVAVASDLASAVAEVARRGGQGLLVSADALFEDNKSELMDAVLVHALPMATYDMLIPEVGALVSYDRLGSEQQERVAALIDRILRGAKPGDLPVAQPTKFRLIVNLKTAKALRLTIPQSLLVRADEVIR
jgi:putative tryptophan/tyrosine transport system substrate-binding protein